MLWNKSYYGTALSIFLHLLILALPFSLEIKEEYKEEELLLVVIDNKKIPMAGPKHEKENCNCENCNCKNHTIRKQQKVVKKKQPQKIPPKKSIKRASKRKQSKIRPRKKPHHRKLIVNEKPVKEALAISKPIKPLKKNPQISPLPEINENDVSDRGDESSLSTLSDKAPYKRDESASPAGSNNLSENDTIASARPIDAKFGSLEGPRFLHREIPRYPRMALKRRKEGVVLLRLTIDKNGNLINVNVEKDGGYGFAQSAIDAVRKSTFYPAKRNGKPIACKCLLPVKFVLN